MNSDEELGAVFDFSELAEVGNWVEEPVRSKVVKLEEITDVQYGGVGEKFLDLSGDVDLGTNFCVWDEDAEEKQIRLREKFSVMSIVVRGMWMLIRRTPKRRTKRMKNARKTRQKEDRKTQRKECQKGEDQKAGRKESRKGGDRKEDRKTHREENRKEHRKE